MTFSFAFVTSFFCSFFGVGNLLAEIVSGTFKAVFLSNAYECHIQLLENIFAEVLC